MKWIIVAGDVLRGFRFIGPFNEEDIATDYADLYLDNDWDVAELKEPDDR